MFTQKHSCVLMSDSRNTASFPLRALNTFWMFTSLPSLMSPSHSSSLAMPSSQSFNDRLLFFYMASQCSYSTHAITYSENSVRLPVSSLVASFTARLNSPFLMSAYSRRLLASMRQWPNRSVNILSWMSMRSSIRTALVQFSYDISRIAWLNRELAQTT